MPVDETEWPSGPCTGSTRSTVKPRACTERLQHAGVAHAIAAEPVIVPDQQCLQSVARPQHLINERFGRQRRASSGVNGSTTTTSTPVSRERRQLLVARREQRRRGRAD